MAFWRLQPRTTAPEVLGFNMPSGLLTQVDYLKTDQTCNGAPVYHSAAPSAYLFVGMDDQMGESYWYLAPEVHSSMVEYDWETEEGTDYPYIGKHPCSSMSWEYDNPDPDMESFEKPTVAFFNSQNWSSFGSGTFAVNASYVYSPVSPLLADGADAYGRIRRVSTALDIPYEDLAFEAVFNRIPPLVRTGQQMTVTVNQTEAWSEIPGDSDTSTPLRTAWGLTCIRTSNTNAHGEISFSDAALNSGKKPLTLSIWFAMLGAVGYGNAALLWVGGSQGAFRVCLNGDTWYNHPVGIGCGTASNVSYIDYTMATEADVRKWHHLVCSFTGYSCSFYLDGVFRGATGCDTSIVKSGTAYIGARNDGGDNFFGLIAGARVYNRVLSEAEIQRLYNEHSDVV